MNTVALTRREPLLINQSPIAYKAEPSQLNLFFLPLRAPPPRVNVDVQGALANSNVQGTIDREPEVWSTGQGNVCDCVTSASRSV